MHRADLEFAELMGVRRKYRESIEQCVDEMLMNALYDAPVDEQGQHMFAEIPTKTRISLRTEQRVVVQYAVRRPAVRGRRARRVRHARTPDRPALPPQGPATSERADRSQGRRRRARPVPDGELGDHGLLQRAARHRDRGGLRVRPRAAKLQLERFGFFTEKIDAAGRLAEDRRVGCRLPPSRRAPRACPPPPPRA